MAKLIYSAITSLDGYVSDARGSFDWAAPSDEVHAFINDLERSTGTYLYGRRMYETMMGWEHAESFADQRQVMQDYGRIWKAAEKIVFSRTLEQVSSARTRIERSFDVERVRALKATAAQDIGVGGAHLAAYAFAAGLVDELRLFLAPVIVGGGTRALPDGVRVELELLDERRFASGVAYVCYRASTGVTAAG